MNHPTARARVARGPVGGQYHPLSLDQIGRIHETSLRVLEEIGVKVELDKARDLFASSGSEVNRKSKRVRIHAQLIEQALREAPKSLRLCGRVEQHDLVVEGERTYFGTGGAAVKVVDLDTHEVRQTRLQDIADFARLAEDLENVDFFVTPCTAQDVAAEDLPVNEFYVALSNTTKHVIGPVYTPAGAQQVIALGEMLTPKDVSLQSRPFLSITISWMNSPLSFDVVGTETLMEVAKKRIPVTLSAAPMAGATSPITLAGTLVQLHAEELAGIVFTQLVSPGAPVIYGGIPSMADMRRLKYIGGGVEFGLMNAAIAQLAHYIGIPNHNSAGITEAKIPDIQAVYEKCFAILQCALSGSNFIHHAAGILESLLTISHEQLVIDNEIIGMARRAVRGIDVNVDKLAFATIRQAQPGGTYVESEHTLDYLNEEFTEPMLADRSDREDWERMGMEGIGDKARRRARTILEAARRRDESSLIERQIDKRIRQRFKIVASYH
jgi:trimethylamine--corrinoid protein Co-methyltransferase